MLSFKVVIPARFASTRLPGKPLLDIGGKPMVIRVAEQAMQSGAQQIVIATDHQPIIASAQEYGFHARMTRADHASGTDRIAEVAAQYAWSDDTIVVNVQGDEPLIPPKLIRGVAQHLHDHPECAIATACHPIHDEASFRNPNVVKVVLDKHGNALYFSRAPIPYPRDTFNANSSLDEPAMRNQGVVGRVLTRHVGLKPDLRSNELSGFNAIDTSEVKHVGLKPDLQILRHIGIYAYRASFLHAYGQLAPAMIEQVESLEQLRALYHGYKIGVTVTQDAPPNGVDTEQDLYAARRIFETQK